MADDHATHRLICSEEFPMKCSPSPTSRHRYIPEVEALEDRRVPTALPLPLQMPSSQPPLATHRLGPIISSKSLVQTITFDPGTLPGVTATELEFYLTAAVAHYSISENRGGDHVKVYHLQVKDVQIPPLVSRTTIALHADFKYRKTRGLVQFQTGGSLDFTVQPLIRATLRLGHVLKAVILPQNLTVTALNVNRVPGWLSNSSKIRDWLSHQRTVAPVHVPGFVPGDVAPRGRP